MTRLILIPTPLEQQAIEPGLREHLKTDDRIELCGFGVIAAAARTAQLLSAVRPAHVILTGIAGAFGDAAELGEALQFSEVACWGIGSGSGQQHQTTAEMGWSHFERIQDRIQLDSAYPHRQLLTVTAASADQTEAFCRAGRFPDALAEDMEGFAVALACRLADTPLTIVRGISNRAGDRNKQNWQINQALSAATRMVTELL